MLLIDLLCKYYFKYYREFSGSRLYLFNKISYKIDVAIGIWLNIFLLLKFKIVS